MTTKIKGALWLCRCGQFNTVTESKCMACGGARNSHQAS